ncbi:MAG TPA: glycosyltransferase family 2 protein [Candidatus Binataceae bacterium]|nr:glycosyltransferase family 2 protein [Candidatus Binataceae bacterium]
MGTGQTKRDGGAELFSAALPISSRACSRELFVTYAAIFFTVVFLAIGVFAPGWDLAHRVRMRSWTRVVLDAAVVGIVSMYVWGQLIYEWCRLAYVRRLRDERPATREELDAILEAGNERLLIMVPSLSEPVHTLRLTLMSAALMKHPNREVVLLIDNPPDDSDPLAVAELEATRSMVREIERTLRRHERRYVDELGAAVARHARGELDLDAEIDLVNQLLEQAAQWFEDQAASVEVHSHADAFFVERILRAAAREHRERGWKIRTAIAPASAESILREYRMLAKEFAARISFFERKRYENLSHTSNKATNLNSYLGLIGGNYRSALRDGRAVLEPCPAHEASLSVRDADYVLICDADTLLLSDYALEALYAMQQPQGARIGIAQVPSLAIPGSPVPLQLTAGAETDLHRILCLGSAERGGAFWLGSNAVIRRRALEDICEIDVERGFPIKRYIKDRTLVEDIESTIDFLEHDWQIFNLTGRLAYRGTPDNYGALLVQRRRWAGGGFVNLPKYLRCLMRQPDWKRSVPEALLRLHHLGAQTVNLGGLLLPLLVLARAPLRGWWLWIAAPYYALCQRDLIACGYKLRDLLRLLALNLLLIAVNIMGTFGALHRAWTGRKRAFPRTPKSGERIAMPAGYVLVALVSPLLMILASAWSAKHLEWSSAIFCSINTLLLGYGLIAFVGLRDGANDLRLALRGRFGSRARDGLAAAPALTAIVAPASPAFDDYPEVKASERSA